MVTGIDLDASNGEVDWNRIAQAGHSFAFIRAAYGDQPDPRMLENIAHARAAGVACGIYHLLRATRNYSEQIAVFLAQSKLAGLHAGDLPPALRLEDNADNDGEWQYASTDSFLTAADRWVAAVSEQSHVTPFVQTRARFWSALANPSGFSDCPLWVASHRPNRPKLPISWNRYTIWQYSIDGRVDGARGKVGMNSLANPAPQALEELLVR